MIYSTAHAEQTGLSEQSPPSAATMHARPGQHPSTAVPVGQHSNENSTGKGGASAHKRTHAAMQPLIAHENGVVKRPQAAWTQASDDSDDLMI